MSSSKVTRPTNPDGLVLEAWGQGLMVGSLLVMAVVTVCNMKKHVLLHKLILAEACLPFSSMSVAAPTSFYTNPKLILALPHNTFIFAHEPAYGWYLSVTAIGLNLSWALHNVIAWMKNRPFLSRRVSLAYIITVVLSWPYWVVEIYANFTYFNNINTIFLITRPWEPLFRDPWWVATTVSLFWTIKREYNFGIWELVKVSPRFGIMLLSMCLSIAFIIVDTCSVVNVFSDALPTGIEPFWKLAFIFKCLCDTVILDDFKTALDHIRKYWLRKQQSASEAFLTSPVSPSTDRVPIPPQLHTPPRGRRAPAAREYHDNIEVDILSPRSRPMEVGVLSSRSQLIEADIFSPRPRAEKLYSSLRITMTEEV
ncbi:hypothetical protein N7510_003832 [Penicillium lagena]|uniref:uncharacterized protein n=1 Tax=Penicillium lagena TaxID=94218 RepID=UPI002541BFE3|nr:uncharacterized protein N7510_003832 [Penicillium lagena]KAJ5619848.1 hypothetical protein N7510_003832 [Penicillium lagena]